MICDNLKRDKCICVRFHWRIDALSFYSPLAPPSPLPDMQQWHLPALFSPEVSSAIVFSSYYSQRWVYWLVLNRTEWPAIRCFQIWIKRLAISFPRPFWIFSPHSPSLLTQNCSSEFLFYKIFICSVRTLTALSFCFDSEISNRFLWGKYIFYFRTDDGAHKSKLSKYFLWRVNVPHQYE